MAIDPDSASGEGSFVDINSFASAIYYIVAFVAFFADAFLEVKLLTGSLNFAANSIFIKVVSVGAFNAGVDAPDFAAEVIIELD